MAKPTKSTEWATDGAALKADPDAGQISYGWSTSDNTISGTPVKPNLQQQNGWQNAVHQWKEYLESATDQNASDIVSLAETLGSRTTISLDNNTPTNIQDFSAFDAVDLMGYVEIQGISNDYRSAVRLSIVKNGAGTYEVAASDIAGDAYLGSPIVGFSMSGAILQATLDSGLVLAETPSYSFIKFSLSDPFGGAYGDGGANIQVYTMVLSSDGPAVMNGTIKFVRIGDAVTYTSDGPVTHDSAHSPASTSVIPADFRPSSNVYNTIKYSETAGLTAIVQSTGVLEIQYRDETSTVNENGTSVAVSGSYVII